MHDGDGNARGAGCTCKALPFWLYVKRSFAEVFALQFREELATYDSPFAEGWALPKEMVIVRHCHDKHVEG